MMPARVATARLAYPTSAHKMPLLYCQSSMGLGYACPFAGMCSRQRSESRVRALTSHHNTHITLMLILTFTLTLRLTPTYASLHMTTCAQFLSANFFLILPVNAAYTSGVRRLNICRPLNLQRRTQMASSSSSWKTVVVMVRAQMTAPSGRSSRWTAMSGRACLGVPE